MIKIIKWHYILFQAEVELQAPLQAFKALLRYVYSGKNLKINFTTYFYFINMTNLINLLTMSMTKLR